MKMLKRIMALALCLAMLLSGFALAESEAAPVQEQEQIQDETDSKAEGGHSEKAPATGDKGGKSDAAASSDSGKDDAHDSAPAASQSDSKQGKDNASSEAGEQDKHSDASDGAADEPKTSDDEKSSETAPEPDAADEPETSDGENTPETSDGENTPETSDGEDTPETSPEPDAAESEPEADEDGAIDETEDAEDAELDSSMLTAEGNAELDAVNATECLHENEQMTEEWDEPTGEIDNLQEAGHEVHFIHHSKTTCLECGEVLDRSETETSRVFDHNLTASDGVFTCEVCGYSVACKHEYKTTEEIVEPATDLGDYVKAQNAESHTIKVHVWEQEHCEKCDKRWEKKPLPDREISEAHVWDEKNGGKTCLKCGYKNACTHQNLENVDELDDIVSATKINANEHTAVYVTYTNVRCMNCGLIIERDVEIERWTQTDAHSFNELSDGTIGCSVCGYVIPCKHPSAYVEKLTDLVSRDDLDPISTGPNTHTVYADRYVQYHCKRCDTWWGYEVTEYGVTQTESHMWDSNDGSECVICGHENTCTHEGTTEEYEEEDYRLLPSLTTATTHSKNPFGVKGKYCTKCGADFDRIATGDADTIVTEPHKFVRKGGKNVCEVCGYIKAEKKTESSKKTTSTEKTTTSTQVQTATSEFAALAKGTVVHGVTVGQPTRMGVTMAQAMAGIAAEYGSDAKIEIQNIDKVLTADECAALNALQPRERILVALDAIGYDGEVENAIAALQLTLSDEAQALSQKVDARVAQMDDEAKSAHQKAIAKYFPNANGVSITLVIRNASGTSVRRERYSFAQSKDEWMFTKLEVAYN